MEKFIIFSSLIILITIAYLFFIALPNTFYGEIDKIKRKK